MVPAGQSGESVLNAWFRRGKVVAEEGETRKRAEDVIAILRLGHVRNELAGNLSGGQKKLLELGRVMMAKPRVVLLDEIAAGVNRTLLNDLAGVVERLNREDGLTFFVIEHDMDLIASLCDPVIVLAEGTVLMEGTMEEVRKDPRVLDAYLGGGDDEAAA
jgi:branched-chain amino acid transport system ATP-binding protein